MKRTLPHPFGCFVGLLLCGQMVAAQTQPGAGPAKPQTTQHATQGAEADSAISADLGIGVGNTGVNAVRCFSPSANWYETENTELLRMIGEASQNAQEGVETELRYEQKHPNWTLDRILAERISMLKDLLDSESQSR